jgi:TrmH family RNA methyltransferase
MKNMGVSRLRLVNPEEFDAYRITGIAHRTEDLVYNVEMFEHLEDAVSDATYVVGTTARARTAGRNYGRPREVAPRLVKKALEGPAAIVFGREDRGLSNRALDLCHEVVIVPTDPEYSSLNLAQACLLVLYEVFLAAEGDGHDLPSGKRSTGLATQGEMEEMYAALESGLDRIDFFKARKPSSVLRTLRTLLSRAQPETREARLVRAIGFEIGHYLDRRDSAP